MLTLPSCVRIFVAAEAVDLRRYPEYPIMPSTLGSRRLRACATEVAASLARHNHRPSRNFSRRSGGR